MQRYVSHSITVIYGSKWSRYLHGWMHDYWQVVQKSAVIHVAMIHAVALHRASQVNSSGGP